MGWLDHEREIIEALRWRLLDWYGDNQRNLPWRGSGDPYAVWVSEIMLQQTRVAVVVERYAAFLSRFPNLESLAAAPEQDVLALWSGLGYYRRARMLHKAAQFVVENHGGRLPATAAALRLLPGIGTYTAAAIASIAHDERVAVVDGNVERVLCRLYGWEAPARAGSSLLRRRIQAEADKLVDPRHPGDFNQAMMELGATVCTPRNPRCLACPLATECATRGEHRTGPRPRMLSQQVACALVLRTGSPSGPAAKIVTREVLLEQRSPEQTVMPDLWELPALREVEVPDADLRMTVRHAIMQTNYYVRVRNVAEEEVDALTVPGGRRCWVSLAQAGGMALTGLTRKVLTRAHLLPTVHLQALAQKVELEVS
ncbi:MAG TPA: A/G-specific adenine glycosylase [Terracidiphilus sp.]|nr:A/G-specific adenine glycosylase [Terracidiphilus sp.]